MAKDKKENNLNTVVPNKYVPSLKKTYEEKIVHKLKSTFNYSNLTTQRNNSVSNGGGKIKTYIDLLAMIQFGDQSNNISII